MAGREVLIVAAHPDDEVLGVGGTAARHAEEGDDVHVLILGEGVTSRDKAWPAGARERELHALREAAKEAALVLGTKEPRFVGFPDNRMDQLSLLDVAKQIETVVDEVAPRIVYTHHRGDLNIDHRIVHDAVSVACRPLPGTPVAAVYGFETVSSSEWSVKGGFVAHRYVEISAQLKKKAQALEAYAAEMRPYPHPRSLESVKALAQVRGSQVGVTAAEAFSVIRERI